MSSTKWLRATVNVAWVEVELSRYTFRPYMATRYVRTPTGFTNILGRRFCWTRKGAERAAQRLEKQA